VGLRKVPRLPFLPAGDIIQAVVFYSFLNDEVNPVLWSPRWSVARDE
jgi:hypothetical protein